MQIPVVQCLILGVLRRCVIAKRMLRINRLLRLVKLDMDLIPKKKALRLAVKLLRVPQL